MLCWCCVYVHCYQVFVSCHVGTVFIDKSREQYIYNCIYIYTLLLETFILRRSCAVWKLSWSILKRAMPSMFTLDSSENKTNAIWIWLPAYYMLLPGFFNLGWVFPGQNSDQAPEVTQPFVEQHRERQELVRKRSKVNSWPIHDPCVAEGRGLQRFLSSCT